MGAVILHPTKVANDQANNDHGIARFLSRIALFFIVYLF